LYCSIIYETLTTKEEFESVLMAHGHSYKPDVLFYIRTEREKSATKEAIPILEEVIAHYVAP
jgi:hypothetical protein